MMYIDVDAAVVLPVNLMPLLDDTDFKTRETAVAYNAAGMDLVWNFVTPAGATTQTAVTPTTAGSYDWTHLGDGMYTIEIPASAGGSINNNTEGYGFFTGVATGVLPWRSPIFCFRAAGLNDLLIETAYSATRGLAGTALPAAAADAAGGLPISDAGGLDMDSIKTDTAAILVDTGTTLDARIPAALVGGKMDANTSAWAGTAVATPDTNGYPKVTIKSGTGTGEISLSSGRVLIQGAWVKNVAVTNFAFTMTDSTNHNPMAGLGDSAVTVSYSHDGGETYTSLGFAAEGVNGAYYKTLTNTSLNADVVKLKITATGADQLDLTINTIP